DRSPRCARVFLAVDAVALQLVVEGLAFHRRISTLCKAAADRPLPPSQRFSRRRHDDVIVDAVIFPTLKTVCQNRLEQACNPRQH
ncbi:hypothetical protein OII43_28035, partial [Achromobacter ruhlandii]|uniref:hypothetical protein n=1 Tax=Achromobacter ruhlandii TaxID=72557 RepID=UPI0021F18431